MKFMMNLLGVLGILAGGAGPGAAGGPKVEGTWTFFERIGSETPILVTAMRGLTPHLEQSRAPIFVFTIQFRDTTDEGFPTSDEYDRLEQLENDLEQIERGHPVQAIGWVTVPNIRTYFFLAESEGQVLGLVTTALGSQGYDLIDWKKADGLVTYLKELQPTNEETALADDRSVLASLAKSGDRADQPRPVDHWSYFPTKDAAQRFADWAESQGFTKTALREGTESGTYLVQLQHIGTMEENSILAKTGLLREKSLEHGGEYDGWETAVIR